jgi:hypothetical protein
MPGRALSIVFERHGDARFLSQLDFLRVVERAIRRSGIPADYTEGFNPRIRISMPPAVPVGVGARGDCFTIRVDPAYAPEDVRRQLERAFPEGIRVLGVTEGKAPADGRTWLSIEVKDGPVAARAVAEALSQGDAVLSSQAFTRESVLFVQPASPSADQRPPRIRDCVARVGQLLERAGYHGGTGEVDRLSGPAAPATYPGVGAAT